MDWHPIAGRDGADGAVAAAEAAGYRIRLHDGQWQASDPAAQAVLDAWTPLPPPPVRIITALAFRDRFSDAEQDAIYAAASALTQPGRQLRRWLDDLSAAPDGMVSLDSPRIVAGVDALVAYRIISAQRRAEILA